MPAAQVPSLVSRTPTGVPAGARPLRRHPRAATPRPVPGRAHAPTHVALRPGVPEETPVPSSRRPQLNPLIPKAAVTQFVAPATDPRRSAARAKWPAARRGPRRERRQCFSSGAASWWAGDHPRTSSVLETRKDEGKESIGYTKFGTVVTWGDNGEDGGNKRDQYDRRM